MKENAEIVCTKLLDDVGCIVHNTSWNIKGMSPEEMIKMVEVKSAFLNIEKKLNKMLAVDAKTGQ